jgi:hypothetical protein
MVTGIETAGLALPAFPLAIATLEHYRKGLEPLKLWWRFRTEYQSFLNEIAVHRAMYCNNLEKLLKDLVTEPTQMKARLDSPGGEAWKDARLEQQLRDFLSRLYVPYCKTTAEIEKALRDLADKLKVEVPVDDKGDMVFFHHFLFSFHLSFPCTSNLLQDDLQLPMLFNVFMRGS